MAGTSGQSLCIRRMVDPVCPDNRFKLARVHAIDTTEIDAALQWIHPALVMGIDPACSAEEMFRRVSAPSVKRQVVSTLQNANRGGNRGDRGSTSAAAERAVAPRGRGQPLGQGCLKHNGTAMATCAAGLAHLRRTWGIRLWLYLYRVSGCGGWPSVCCQ